MKRRWEPEFERSIEEIMDYRDMAILSVRFLWRAHAPVGFHRLQLIVNSSRDIHHTH
jgi:hypothetical protein